MKSKRDTTQLLSSKYICSSDENGKFDAIQNENKDGSLLRGGNADGNV